MRPGAAVLCAVLGAASLLPAEDVGTPEAVLAEGIALVQQGDFEAAVLKLDEASRRLAADPSRRTSRPPAAGLTRPLADAYLYLGISYLELNQELNARAKFREVLRVEPTRKLSDRVFSPQIIRVFEAARVEMFPNEKKKRSILPFLLIAGGGAASAAVVVASGGDQPTTTQPATTVPTTAPGTGGGNPTTTTSTTVGNDPGPNPTTTTTTTTTTLPGASTTLPGTTPPSSSSTTTTTTTTTTSSTTLPPPTTTMPCSYDLKPPSTVIILAGGAGTCTVTTNKPTCAWTARTNGSWLDLGGVMSGPGNGVISWTAGLTLSARVGDIFLENTDAPSPLRCVVSQGGILPGVADASNGTVLKSRLDVERARAQVIVDGAAVHYVGAGDGAIDGPTLPAGVHRVVGQLVDGSALRSGGQWRFDLSGPVEPGSLQAAGGEVVMLSERAIAFRLAGKSGERVVFTFRYR